MKSIRNLTIGIELERWKSYYCVIDRSGKILDQGFVATTANSFRRTFEQLPPAEVVVLARQRPEWVTELFVRLGHTVSWQNMYASGI